MRRHALKLAVLATLTALPALAQIPAENIRGKVRALEGDRLTVATREGRTAIVTLSQDWSVAVTRPLDIRAIKPGDVIGVAEIETSGGGQCLEAHLFPPGTKTSQGHYPWDLKPGASMTRGAVIRVAAAPRGRALEIGYPAGTRHIVVPPTAPVVAIGAGDRMMLKPGVSLFIQPIRTPDGGWAADRVLIGEKDQAPPM